jgi:molybdopterin-guanine dinucleotide biosynthesis protein A/rhodanese-related sulfurtransferase
MTVAAGVVLAGGASTRMGVDKAFVSVGGRPMVALVADALRAGGCDPVWVQGGDLPRLEALGLTGRPDPVITDPVFADPTAADVSGVLARPGPVAAIAAALAASAAPTIVVAACDLPSLTGAVVSGLVRVSSTLDTVAVAAAGGRRHLVAAWPGSVGVRVDEAMARGVRSYGDLLAAVGAVEVDVDPRAVHNVNRPDDLPAGVPGQRYPRAAMTVPEISVDELAPLLDAGARLVDVREPDEFGEARVPGAILVPLATVPDSVDVFRSEGTTYVICRSGARSMQACAFLARQGIDVANVAGGTLAWIDSGRDVAAGPA